MTRSKLVAVTLVSVMIAACTDSRPHSGVDPVPTDPPPSDGCPTGPFVWPVETHPVAITPSSAWKTTLAWEDPFIVTESTSNGVRWAKFTILIDDPTVAYFQDASAERFHAEFATAHLDPFLGMTLTEFDRVALHAEAQRAVVGTVLFPALVATHEVGIQLARYEPFHPEMALRLLELVARSLALPEGTQRFYFPAYEQQHCSGLDAASYEVAGFPLDSAARFSQGNGCYSAGWAVGRLRQVEGTAIAVAYEAGTLLPTDILVTDGVPAEMPYVSGILALTPSTPNSHVAILATSFGIPFAYAPDLTARAAEYEGRFVALATREPSEYFGPLYNQQQCEVDLYDLEPATVAEREALLALKAPVPLDYEPKTSPGVLARDVDDIGPADLPSFGGKAAHFGLLRDVIPENSPQAVGFSFDLWDHFMAQTLPEGETLRQAIATKLAPHVYPPVMAAVFSDLRAVRQLIRDGDFTADDDAAIVAALAPFDANINIRFRSSTNLEDSAGFTGAGLYDSFSGCLADNIDGDDLGPSRCDATEPEERGVKRAIKKVFASFYNDNAFLERLRRGVTEDEIGMAVLAHTAFPDDNELANGVATTEQHPTRMTATLVSQLGAVSVTNPTPGVLPEVMATGLYGFGSDSTLVSPSSLVPRGATVLRWHGSDPALDEYLTLAALLLRVGSHYANVTQTSLPISLDFEYKKVEPDRLVFKQVRPMPPLYAVATQAAFLVPEPVSLCVYQGELTNIFAAHRLKSRWEIVPDPRFLDAAGIASSALQSVAYTYVSGPALATLTGPVTSFPAAEHSTVTIEGRTLQRDSFTLDVGGTRELALVTEVPALQPVAANPFVTVGQPAVQLVAHYPTAVPAMDYDHTTVWVSDETVSLVSCTNELPVEELFEAHHTLTHGGVTIDTTYYLGPWDFKTFPLAQWGTTTITGLTAAPIQLTSPYAQTMVPYHHNFGATFIFEPRLEEGLDATSRAELEAADVVAIFATTEGTVYVAGSSGVFRAFP